MLLSGKKKIESVTLERLVLRAPSIRMKSGGSCTLLPFLSPLLLVRHRKTVAASASHKDQEDGT